MILLIALLLAAPGKDPARALAQRVQHFYAHTKDFSAKFAQHYSYLSMGRTEDSAGTVQVKKPGSVRWDYEKPDKRTLYVQGKTLWIWRPDDQEGQVKRDFGAEVALDLPFLVVGAPDPERLALDVEGALVGLFVIPADRARLLHLHRAGGVLGPAHREIAVVLRELRREIFGVRVEMLHALRERPRWILAGRREQECDQEDHVFLTRRASFAANSVKRACSSTRASSGRSPAAFKYLRRP